MELYKYQGAGNDFLIGDNRGGDISLTRGQIVSLCDRRYGIGADGLMLLENPGPVLNAASCVSHAAPAFRMTYYNSDGSGGMMCGNGGRCIAAFASFLGIRGMDFIAADGMHTAQILSTDGKTSIVRLGMKDVSGITACGSAGGDVPPGYFLDTGTRHFVKIVSSPGDCDVVVEGRRIREAAEFAPEGTNVNFAMPDREVLRVRTYEKGVEAETFACGTGITASAIAVWHHASNLPESERGPFSGLFRTEAGGRVSVEVRALRDSLAVDFLPSGIKSCGHEPSGLGAACGVHLTGPATYIGKIII